VKGKNDQPEPLLICVHIILFCTALPEIYVEMSIPVTNGREMQILPNYVHTTAMDFWKKKETDREEVIKMKMCTAQQQHSSMNFCPVI
jgi:hypothetical protein